MNNFEAQFKLIENKSLEESKQSSKIISSNPFQRQNSFKPQKPKPDFNKPWSNQEKNNLSK